MQLILHLIQKYSRFLLFFVLELIALFLTIQFHSYQKSKFINSANNISGGLYNNVSTFRNYLYLKNENEILAKENARLINYISSHSVNNTVYFNSNDSIFKQRFKYTPAKIINNDFHKNNNYLTLNKGEKDSITIDMAVVNSKGIIGIITNTSTNYASAISILNTNFKTNARLKNNNYFGTLTWSGKSTKEVQLKDIPRQADIKIGDTIVTGGRSSVFPEGILIGSISNIEYLHDRHELINVVLFNDIRNVENVQLIKNLHKKEIKTIENNQHE